MSRRRTHAIALSGLLLTACAQPARSPEANPLLCANGIDDDGDGLEDCDDPDCWSLALCRVLRSPPASGPEAPPSSDEPQAPTSEQHTDPLVPVLDDDPVGQDLVQSERLDAAAPGSDAASPPFALDAGCGCDAGCEPCTGPTSEPLGRFEITRIAVSVPRAVSSERCLDPADSCILDRPNAQFTRCRCAPDPRVVVYLDDTELGATETRAGADTAVWTSPGIELDLYDGARLGFEVLESDEGEAGEGDDGNDANAPAMEHVFDCEIVATIAHLASGNIQCGRTFRTDLGADAHFDVRVRLQKIAAGTAP